jgi:hypothetical protein
MARKSTLDELSQPLVDSKHGDTSIPVHTVVPTGALPAHEQRFNALVPIARSAVSRIQGSRFWTAFALSITLSAIASGFGFTGPNWFSSPHKDTVKGGLELGFALLFNFALDAYFTHEPVDKLLSLSDANTRRQITFSKTAYSLLCTILAGAAAYIYANLFKKLPAPLNTFDSTPGTSIFIALIITNTPWHYAGIDELVSTVFNKARQVLNTTLLALPCLPFLQASQTKALHNKLNHDIRQHLKQQLKKYRIQRYLAMSRNDANGEHLTRLNREPLRQGLQALFATLLSATVMFALMPYFVSCYDTSSLFTMVAFVGTTLANLGLGKLMADGQAETFADASSYGTLPALLSRDNHARIPRPARWMLFMLSTAMISAGAYFTVWTTLEQHEELVAPHIGSQAWNESIKGIIYFGTVLFNAFTVNKFNLALQAKKLLSPNNPRIRFDERMDKVAKAIDDPALLTNAERRRAISEQHSSSFAVENSQSWQMHLASAEGLALDTAQAQQHLQTSRRHAVSSVLQGCLPACGAFALYQLAKEINISSSSLTSIAFAGFMLGSIIKLLVYRPSTIDAPAIEEREARAIEEGRSPEEEAPLAPPATTACRHGSYVLLMSAVAIGCGLLTQFILKQAFDSVQLDSSSDSTDWLSQSAGIVVTAALNMRLAA